MLAYLMRAIRLGIRYLHNSNRFHTEITFLNEPDKRDVHAQSGKGQRVCSPLPVFYVRTYLIDIRCLARMKKRAACRSQHYTKGEAIRV